MALTPQVVEDWIKENVCADKDKSPSKKDIWSSFHAGLPFISIEERANFFSIFGFAIKKFANVSVIKWNSKKVGYQRTRYGIVLRFIMESRMNSIVNDFLHSLEYPLLAMVCFRPCR